MSCMTMLSVISRISVGAASPVSARMSRTSSTISGRASCRADRLTAMWNGGSIGNSPCSSHRVAARLAEHPAADRHDQSGLFGERDELERLHDAALRVDPADQGLDARDPSRLELDHGLVVQDELVVLERTLQVGLQLEAAQRGVVHLGLEHLVATLALLLRHVHRDVGVAHAAPPRPLRRRRRLPPRRRCRRSRGRRLPCPRARTAPRASA